MLHYRGMVNGKRVYARHPAMGIGGNNGNQSMGINKTDSSFFNQNKRGCRLAWSRLGDLGSLDPGPNPGSPTNFRQDYR